MLLAVCEPRVQHERRTIAHRATILCEIDREFVGIPVSRQAHAVVRRSIRWLIFGRRVATRRCRVSVPRQKRTCQRKGDRQ